MVTQECRGPRYAQARRAHVPLSESALHAGCVRRRGWDVHLDAGVIVVVAEDEAAEEDGR
jgi:hypothetical protein